MQKYIGTKLIDAEPALATEEDKHGIHPVGAPGYRVKYKNNYISWSPKKEFEDAYQLTENMSFGYAMIAGELGYKVARRSWPENKYLFIDKKVNKMYICLISVTVYECHLEDFDDAMVYAEDWYIVNY